MQAGEEQLLGLAMKGRGTLSPQLPRNAAGQRAELTPQQSISAVACQEPDEAEEAFHRESRQLNFAVCPSRPAGSLHESTSTLQSAHQLELQLAFLCGLPLAQLQPKLLSPPESTRKTHVAGRRSPLPLHPPHHQCHHHPSCPQQHPATEPTLLTRVQPAGEKSRD